MPESAAFISYAREDLFMADRIRRRLQEHHLPVFQDLISIRPGEAFRGEIREGIGNARCVVLLVSMHAAASVEVLAEIKVAQQLSKPIIPVILDEKAVDKPNPVLSEIADLQRIYLHTKKGRTDISPVARAVRRRWVPTAPVIAFSNLKGGVGKTTLAAHLSSCLSHLNQLSILMIDLDPQSNLSQFVLPQHRLEELIDHDRSVLSLFERSLVYGAASPRRTLFDVSTDLINEPNVFATCDEVEGSEFAKLVQGNERKPVFIIPGQFELVKYTLPRNAGALNILKENFARSVAAARKEFDAIIIDLNPSSSFMIECALTAATHVVCPIRPDKYSVQGLKGLRTLIDTAFGLAKPPEILPIFNGVPTWDENFVSGIGEALSVPERRLTLERDEKTGAAAAAIASVLSDPVRSRSVITVPIPETPMLKAYHEARSGGFFALGRFERGGAYGARLGRRLMSAATEIARIAKADSLNDDHPAGPAQEAQANS